MKLKAIVGTIFFLSIFPLSYTSNSEILKMEKELKTLSQQNDYLMEEYKELSLRKERKDNLLYYSDENIPVRKIKI
jgi:chromosome segregation and condensation protein ScpB